jgi:hypothetical protein
MSLAVCRIGQASLDVLGDQIRKIGQELLLAHA